MMKYALVLLAGCTLVEGPDVGPLQPTQPDAGSPSGDAGFTSSGPCSDSNADTVVSFSQQIRPLFSRLAGGCGCHNTLATSGFNLGTYENLRRGGQTSGTRVIVVGKPCESVLAQKLGLAPPFGSRMPYNGPPYFTAAELTLVRDWIAEGALNN